MKNLFLSGSFLRDRPVAVTGGKMRPPAFTLVELLVVIIIAALVASFAVPAIRNAIERGRENRVRSELRHLAAIVEEVYSDIGCYVRLEDLVEEDTARPRRWRNNDYIDGRSDNDLFMILGNSGVHTQLNEETFVDTMLYDPHAEWEEMNFYFDPEDPRFDPDHPLFERPRPLVWLYNLSTDESAVIVSNTANIIETDPHLAWQPQDVYRIGEDRDVADLWRGPYTTYKNFVNVEPDTGLPPRLRPIDTWGERHDEITAPFHQYRMFWSEHPGLLAEGAEGVMVIISAGRSGRLDSLPGRPRPDQATAADFADFDPDNPGDDIFIAFSAGLSMVTRFSDVDVWEVVFNLDGKAERTGGGHLLQRVVHGEAATEPDIDPVPAPDGWQYFRAWYPPEFSPTHPRFSEVRSDMTIDPIHRVELTYELSEGGLALHYTVSDHDRFKIEDHGPPLVISSNFYPEVHSHGPGAKVADVTAEAENGFRFHYWEDGEGNTSHLHWRDEDNEILYDDDWPPENIMEPTTYTAYFIKVHTVNLSADPSVGGTVSGAGEYDDGASVTISAEAAEAHQFDRWTNDDDGDAMVSEEAEYTFTIEDDRNFTARFIPAEYEISVTASPAEGGTVSGGGIYTHGEEVLVSADAHDGDGYEFVNWTEGGAQVSTSADFEFTAEADRDLVANFQLREYTLTYTAGENGTVDGQEEVVQVVEHGSDGAPVNAAPDEGYHFTEWSDGNTANPRTETNVTADLTVEAQFAINEYTLTYIAGAGGSLAGEVTQTVEHGSSGTAVEAIPDENHHFVRWSDGVTANPRTDENVTGDIDVEAEFALDEYTLTYTAGPGGSIDGQTTQTVEHGSSGTAVEAMPDEGYHFTEWSDGNTANPRTDVNVTDDISVEAQFALNEYTLNYTAGPGGSLVGETTQTVEHGSDGTAVEAVPDEAEGYHFDRWSDGETDNPRTDGNVTGDISVTAEFALNEYEIILQRDPAEGGTVSGGGTYEHGQSVTVSASAATGYEFDNWTEAGSVASSSSSYNFTAESDRTLVANFDLKEYTLTYTAGDNGAVNTDTQVVQTVQHGADGDPVEAMPDEGYYFTAWGDGRVDNPRTDTNVQGNLSVTASFAERFTDHEDGTVTDEKTGLTWTLDAGHGPLSWGDASDYCADLVLGGHSDWRLPSLADWAGLLDTDRSDPALPAGHPFAGVENAPYWTSQEDGDDAWRVDLSDGTEGVSDKASSHYTWPVRGPD